MAKALDPEGAIRKFWKTPLEDGQKLDPPPAFLVILAQAWAG